MPTPKSLSDMARDLAAGPQSDVMKGAAADMPELPANLKRELTPEVKAQIDKNIAGAKARAGSAEDKKLKLADPKTVTPVLLNVEREADRRWREWLPTKEDRVRPTRSQFEKMVRDERGITETKKMKVQPKAPAKPKAATPKKESAMRTNTKAKPASTGRAKAKTSARRAPGKAARSGARQGTKLELIVKLLKRSEGCTTADVLKATKWPSVSMPQQAKAAGLKLKKEKDGKVTRYRAD